MSIFSPITNDTTKLIAKNRKFIETGDSIIENGIFSDSDDVRRHQRGMLSYLLSLYPFAFTHHNTETTSGAYNATGHNVANGGWLTHEMLSNFETDVLTKNPAIIRISGGTNDLQNDVSWQSIAANLQAMCDMALARGAIICLDKIRPRSDKNSRIHSESSKDWANSTIRTQWEKLNEWIAQYGSQHRNIIVMDLPSILKDSNGNLDDDYCYDGLHLNAVGAYVEAQYYATQLQKHGLLEAANHHWAQPSAYHASDNPFGNLLGTADFSGTTGSTGTGATGTAPTGWTLNRTDNAADTITASMADEVALDGSTQPTTTLSLTLPGTGSDGGIYRLYTGTITSGVTSGEFYEFFCEYELAASSAVRSLYVRFLDKSSGGIESNHFATRYSYSSGSANEKLYMPNAPLKGILHPNAIQTAGSSGLQILIYLDVDETIADIVTLKLRKPTLRQLAKNPLWNDG